MQSTDCHVSAEPVHSRSAWCPGYITCHDNDPCDQDLDAIAWLPPGETHDVQFEIVNPTPGAWWSYSLAIYWR